jgi:hypothetical protein
VEGLYFYWFSWAMWIVMTFISKKSSIMRFPIACFMLLAIIISPYSFTFKGYSISYISIYILTVIFIRIGYFSFKNKVYFFITTLIVAIGYVTFLLFELFDPIWLIFRREWMLAIVITYLSVLLQNKFSWRVSTMIVGCVYGDILFSIIIHPFSFPYTIGAMNLLDVCSLATIMLFGWEGIKVSIGYFESLYHTVERGKQKTT